MTIRSLCLWAFLFCAALFAAQTPQIKDIDIAGDTISIKLSKQLQTRPKSGKIEIDGQTKEILRFYFDIDAALTSKPPHLQLSGAKDLKIAQFDKDTVRIALTASKDAKFDIDEKKETIVIKYINQQTNVQPKKEQKPEVKEQRAEKEDKPEQATKEQGKDEIKKAPKKEESYFVSKRKTVVLDPGHGGKDPGAVGIGGIREKDLVLRLSEFLRDMLQKKGYKVYLTRDSDEFIELRDRTKFANKKNADLFVSIHANAIDTRYSDPDKAQGIETYFLSPARSERAKRAAEKEDGVSAMDFLSKQTFLNFLNREKIVASNKLAIDVQRGMLTYAKSKYSHTVDGGVKEAPFWVLVGALMPAVLVEIGYVTNPEDAEKLSEDYYKALLAKGIMEGIENYFHNN